MDVIVAGAAEADGSRPALFWAESTLRLTAGRAPFALELPMAARDARGLLLDVRLLGLDPPTVAGQTSIEMAR